MAEGVRVEVKGLTKLTRALRSAGVKVADMKAANVRVAEVVVHAAVPITARATGALAGSVRPGKRQSGAVVYAGGGRIRYARFVEFGTRKMAARPYLYRAAGESQPEWLDVYAKELQALMDEVGAASDGTGE
jgi:HK97 gp10 family phage protein